MEEVAIALNEIQSALPVALQPSQELLLAVPIIEAETVEVLITENDEGQKIVAAAKAKISAVLSKFARSGKRAVTLAANMADVKSGAIPVPAKASSSDGLTDYLRQLEVAEVEVW